MKTISLILISMIISAVVSGTSIPVPSKSNVPINSIEDILKTIDPVILPKVPYEPQFGEDNGGSHATVNFIVVLNQKAADIRNYIASKYAEDLSNLSNIEVITMGIMLVPFERRDMFQMNRHLTV